jgi:hypothetical protein
MTRQSFVLFGWLILAGPLAAQAQFIYFTTNNITMTITAYTGTNDDVVIPSMIEGLPVGTIGAVAFSRRSITSVTIPDSVTSIGWNAFEFCTNLPSILIPNGVTSIADSLFYGCSSLTSVTIPNSVTSIGYSAFRYCYSLTNVTIPNSVTSIGDNAFIGTGLISVSIPHSVTNIGGGAFIDCPNLTAIDVETNNPAYSSVNGVLFNQSQTSLIEYPGGKVGSYSAPNGVTSIWNSAFNYCSGLTNVTIPDSVTNIGDYAFFRCDNLTALTVETNNPAYSSVSGVLFDKSQTTLIKYPGGKVGGSYSIPNSVTSIGFEAFHYCTSLTSVTITNSVTSIGDYAFAFCTNLTSVTIPNSIISLGDSAFLYCHSLTNVTIPNSVTSIANALFAGCSSLTSVTIPKGITSLGDSAFSGCSTLTSVYFQGNAPSTAWGVFGGGYGSPIDNATAYRLPGTTGWQLNFYYGIPLRSWSLPYPIVLNDGLGVQSKQFSFTVSWATNLSVVVEATTDLGNPVWSPLATNALSGGTFYFSDPQWTNYPSRFYRIRSP